MKPIPYFEILKRALLITWKNKFLWVFGFFISLGSGMSNASWNPGGDSAKSEMQMTDFINFIKNHPHIFAGIIFAIIFLAIILLILRIISSAGIIKAASNIAVYGQSTIRGIFSETKKYFWPLIIIEVAVGLAVFTIIFIMFMPIVYLFLLKSYALGAALLISAILISIPLVILACYIRKYAFFYIIIGNIKMKMAFESAYVLFRKNIKESLLMGIIAIAINVAIIIPVFIFLLAFILLCAPFGLAAYLVFAKTGAFIVLIVGVIFGIIIFLIFFSGYATFIQTAWVLFFQQISLEKKDEKKVIEKIEAKVEITTPEIV